MALGQRILWVLLAVVLIVILCLAVSVYVTTLPDSPAARSLNEVVLSVFQLACGAIIGLLGGKALS